MAATRAGGSKGREDLIHAVNVIEGARRDGIRDSRLIVDEGARILPIFSSPFPWLVIGSEAWELLEKIFIAAIDTGEADIARFCLAKLAKKFTTSSLRVKRLYGLMFEANGQTTDATDNYDRLTTEDPTDAFSMKRKVAMRKAAGDLKGAVELLNEYLQVFMADTEAWAELADLYTSLQTYDSAIFCYEELLIAAPQNFHYFTRYAELLFTAGRIQDSAQYFSFSLELNVDENVRALYGLVLAVSSLKKSEQTAERLAAVEATKHRLEKIYEKKASTQQLDVLRAVLAKLNV